MVPYRQRLFDDIPNPSTLTDAEFLCALKAQNARDMQRGVDSGWWESCDNRGPIPFAIVVRLADLPPTATMAHAIHVAGFAESVGAARKNGWNRPIALGRHVVDKARRAVLVVD